MSVNAGGLPVCSLEACISAAYIASCISVNAGGLPVCSLEACLSAAYIASCMSVDAGGLPVCSLEACLSAACIASCTSVKPLCTSKLHPQAISIQKIKLQGMQTVLKP